MAELFVSHRAEQELRGIWRDISAESPAAADRLLLKIDKRLQALRDFPSMGSLR
jgi:toxin ParE1/3/4